MSSVRIEGDLRLERHVNASQGIAASEFSQSLRTRALGRSAAAVDMLQHKPREKIALDGGVSAAKRVSVSASQPTLPSLSTLLAASKSGVLSCKSGI
jgi:hypothetical protein